MLHTIYAQAHVVSWLGTGRDIDLQAVSSYFDQFARLWIGAVREHDGLRPSRRKCEHNAILRLKVHFESQSTAAPSQTLLHILASIFSAGYFKRVWTVQEIILGKTNVC